MAEPEVKSTEARKGLIFREGVILGLVSVVFALLFGWLTSINAVAWLHPFLLVGAVIFAILFITHMVMLDMLRYGFKQ